MTKLKGIVEINRRFARSARIDADLSGTPPLVGYVLQASVARALSTMARAQADSRQGAFTWTGPYGGGKSSAALLVANMIGGSPKNKKLARELAGDELCELFEAAFPEKRDWHVVAVTGSRTRLRAAIATAARGPLCWSDEAFEAAAASDAGLIDRLLSPGPCNPSVFLILDELGKMLEHEALEGGDVHLLQDLAERASRSDGRLVLVGILHQSFDQYAARARSNARDEWAKVQGRYHDIPFLSGADETVALLGQAISCHDRPSSTRGDAERVAKAVAKRRPIDVGLLTEGLLETWPLNPVTTLLLGPVSRQRFAQNERSLFGFLSSAEPGGFQEFIESGSKSDTYSPARLWDYLSANFGMALASGADSHRFSLAFEAIERAAAKGSDLHVELTKAAAMIEFFRNGSGLAVADDVLAAAVPGVKAAALKAAIHNLLDWAIFIRQPRLGGYALFAGSDFDLDEAVRRSSGEEDDAAALAGIAERVGLGFAAAKRHYFATGALRTFDIVLCPVAPDTSALDVGDWLAKRSQKGSGSIVLLVGDGSCEAGTLEALADACGHLFRSSSIIAAVSAARDGGRLRAAAVELAALEKVISNHPQLEGDRIARREIAARQSALIDELHGVLERALSEGSWRLSSDPSTAVTGSLATVASALADKAFPNAPVIRSELVQRDRPSSNAAAAVRELAHAMVDHESEQFLGIDGFPAEKGLYLTILEPTGLHRSVDGQFGFHTPDDTPAGESLMPAWKVLEKAHDARLGEVFGTWAAPPFGIKKGIMPLLALSYVLANRDKIAVYIDDVFQTSFDDVFADRFLQAPTEVRFRRIDRSHREAAFLSGLAQRLGVTHEGASLPVAQALFQRFEALPPCAKRTQRLNEDSEIVRRIVLKANDPEALLFDALPEAFGDRLSAELVFNALIECELAYPLLLEEMTLALARSLGADLESFAGVTERAETVTGLTNDLNFDAFAMRAAGFEQGNRDIEGLVSLLVHKPASAWSDRDRDQALIEMVRYGRRMRELEALAVVRDRRSDTEALALVIGVDPKVPPLLQSFELSAGEKKKAAALADRLLAALSAEGEADHLKFAALARAVAVLTADASIDAEAA
jgi:hypothetical protein